MLLRPSYPGLKDYFFFTIGILQPLFLPADLDDDFSVAAVDLVCEPGAHLASRQLAADCFFSCVHIGYKTMLKRPGLVGAGKVGDFVGGSDCLGGRVVGVAGLVGER